MLAETSTRGWEEMRVGDGNSSAASSKMSFDLVSDIFLDILGFCGCGLNRQAPTQRRRLPKVAARQGLSSPWEETLRSEELPGADSQLKSSPAVWRPCQKNVASIRQIEAGSFE
jgi:hypothetical protein